MKKKGNAITIYSADLNLNATQKKELIEAEDIRVVVSIHELGDYRFTLYPKNGHPVYYLLKVEDAR